MITPVVRREFTVYLDIVARLGPLNEAAVEQRWEYCDKRGYLVPATTAQNFGRGEQQLLQGLLHNAEALDAWLMKDAMITAGFGFGVKEDTSGEKHLQVLAPVIARMPEPDRAFLQRALERNKLYECAGPLQSATQATVTSMSAVSLPSAEPWTPSGKVVAERRYRVAIGVRAKLSPISPRNVKDVVTELGFDSTPLSVSPKVYGHFQKRLREAVIADEAALHGWLEQEGLAVIADGTAEKFVGGDRDEVTLGPVIAALDPHDRAIFEHALARQVLYECTEGLFEASRQELVGVEVAFG